MSRPLQSLDEAARYVAQVTGCPPDVAMSVVEDIICGHVLGAAEREETPMRRELASRIYVRQLAKQARR